MKRLAPDWRTLLSAVLIVAAFPPWDLSFLAWLCLVPWFWALKRAPSYRAAFIQGLWLCIGMCLLGFYWVAYVLKQFGGLPWPVAIFGLLLFSLVGQPQFLIFGPLLKWIHDETETRNAKSIPLMVIAIATSLVYAGFDWILPKIFADTLGYALHNVPSVRQLASLGSASLITFVVFFTNETLFTGLTRFLGRKEPSIWPAVRSVTPLFAKLAAVLVASVLYGNYRIADLQNRMSGPDAVQVQAAAIQGNIGDFDKLASERGVRGAAEKVLATYIGLSDRAMIMERKPDFLVWPETAYPSTFRTPHTSDELFRDQKVESFVKERNVPLLFGGYDRWQKKDFNALFVLSPKAEPTVAGSGDLQIYRKNVLLLFGEYIPGAESFAYIKQAFPQVGNFGRGIGPDVVSVPTSKLPSGELKAGPVICYEALFPDYILAAAKKGSQLILNITNDSWFGPFGEPQLHLALSAFRSIESGLPQLRATNTGFTALILPDGTIRDRTPLFQPEILNVSIPITPPIPTLMKSWGNWFPPFAVLLGSIMLLTAYARRKRR